MVRHSRNTFHTVFVVGKRQTWRVGEVKGLRARGGFEVDISWKDEKLSQAKIRSILGGTIAVRYGQKTIQLKTQMGKSYRLNESLILTKN